MFTRKPAPPPKTRHIQFVGKTPRRRDNLMRTGLVWLPGEVHMVTDDQAAEFIRYPDVWAEVDAKGKLLADQYLAACEKGNLPPLLLMVNAPVSKKETPPDPDPDAEKQDQGGGDQKQNDAADSGGNEGKGDSGIDDVKAAILSLDRNNPDHFTDKGNPKVAAVREIAGDGVSVAMLNQAWKEIDG